jgi:hypothetical protein
MTDVSVELDQIGDALQRAWREDHLRRAGRARLRPPRRIMLALAVLAVAIGGGAAIAAGVLKSTSDEEQGILGGHRLFAGSEPECRALSATAFRCTLDRPPTGMSFYRQDPNGATVYRGKRYSPASDMFLGVKVPTVDSTSHVDGGCVSISADGRIWNCFLGQSAVDHGVIGAGYLGDYSPEPPTG